MERAMAIGIRKEDVIIDCLTMTVSADASAALTTLESLNSVKKILRLKTALGVSNVSFGLPNRSLLNAAFLTMALQSGLDLPIINPNSAAEMNTVRAFRLLSDQDENAAEYIKAFSEVAAAESAKPVNADLSLADCIIAGLKADAVATTERMLNDTQALEVVNEHLIPALDKVGTDFERGTLFLPQLILAAETAGKCFDVIKGKLGTSAVSEKKDVIILATVYGDIHDIGKNIVKVLLENYGYKVVDLGKDVAPETVADSAAEHNAKLVGLSALMTTTLPAMSSTITLLRERGLPCKVMVGGAVLTDDYAKSIGADFYAKDAKRAVDIAKSMF
jgi:5-methyltetrahydrofolate--homocysteine methyltransferase